MPGRISEKMMEALCCFLKGRKAVWEDGLDAEEWAEFFRLSQHHQILPMVYDAVYSCPAFRTCPEGLVLAVKGQVIRQVMMQSRKTGEFLQLYQKLAEAGLTPLVVKGLVCRSLYREPDYRASGDEDILIPAEQFPECSRIFAENQMLPAEPDKDPEREGEVP